MGPRTRKMAQGSAMESRCPQTMLPRIVFRIFLTMSVDDELAAISKYSCICMLQAGAAHSKAMQNQALLDRRAAMAAASCSAHWICRCLRENICPHPGHTMNARQDSSGHGYG